jgi:16S rRNA (cytidine1402-2'-O)-methyltransferase
MAGKLYMVPTPVGNLEDMTQRAIKVLNQVAFILAEDTRTSAVLMKHYGITTPMRSHHKFNEHDTTASIIDRLEAGDDIALITDAGTPGISDPGFLLGRECRRNSIVVETLPGATAFVPALVNSGLPCERFTFEGFLPVKKGRAARLAELAQEPRTMIFYESPMRLVKTLQQFVDTFGADRQASVCREISKLHDTTHHGTLQELVQHFTAQAPRGEIVIVVAGKETEPQVKVDKYAKFKNKYNPNMNSYEKD